MRMPMQLGRLAAALGSPVSGFLAVTALLLCGLTFVLPAQEEGQREEAEAGGAGDDDAGPEAPEETEIKLPEVLLEVEEAELDHVRARLPETAEARLGDIAIPLPTEAELAISPAAFEVPEPGGEGDTVLAAGDGVSLYSDAVLGVGSMEHIFGSLSLYRLGEQPRFRLQFSHDGRDGYHFEEPGTGFFDRTEDLSGWIEGGERTTARLEAGFVEHERGLQGQPTYFSVKSRFLDGHGELHVPFADRYTFSPRLNGSYAERLRTVPGGSEAGAGAETEIDTGARIGIETAPGTFYADASYLLRYLDDAEDGFAQGIGLALGAELLLGRELSADAEVGVLWPFADYVYVPFSFRLTATPVELLTVNLDAGMKPRPLSFSRWWRDYPTFATSTADGDVPEWSEDWFGRAGVLVDVPETPISSEVSTRVSWQRNVAELEAYRPDQGETVYELVDRLTVEPAAMLRWDFSYLGLETGWRSLLLERGPDQPRHTGRLSLDLRNQEETLGFRADLTEEIFEAPTTPELDLTGHWDVSEAVRISADVLDVLAPMLEDGRARIGAETDDDFPFIEPGFRVVIKTRVSL